MANRRTLLLTNRNTWENMKMMDARRTQSLKRKAKEIILNLYCWGNTCPFNEYETKHIKNQKHKNSSISMANNANHVSKVICLNKSFSILFDFHFQLWLI